MLPRLELLDLHRTLYADRSGTATARAGRGVSPETRENRMLRAVLPAGIIYSQRSLLAVFSDP